MKKVIKLKESDLLRIVKKIILEQNLPSINYGGRTISLSRNGDMIISDKTKKQKTVEFSYSMGKFNLKQINELSGGDIEVCGKICKSIPKETVNEIIKFVDDPTKTEMVIKGGFIQPDIRVKKLNQ